MKLKFLYIVFVITSCSTPSEKATEEEESSFLVKTKYSIEYNAGFNSYSNQIFEEDGREYAAFADFTTRKEIKLFDAHSASLVGSIPLDSIINQGQLISGYTMVNVDSVLVLTEYTNQLYLLNRSGEIIKKVDFNVYLNADTAFMLTTCHPFMTKDKVLYFGVLFPYNENIAMGHIDDVYDQLRIEKQTPYLVEVEGVFSDSIRIRYGLRNFYSRFMGDEETSLERRQVKILNDKIFVHSIFCDTIYEVNPNTLEIDKMYTIKSNFSSFGYKSVTFDETSKGWHNELGQTKGRIDHILYDDDNELYYVLCYLERPLDAPRERNIRPWSYIVYDKNFNKLQEVKMDENVYSAVSPLVIKEGILISNYPQHKNDKDIFTKSTYELFKPVKN